VGFPGFFEMSVIWHKVWFDVWGNKGRSFLVIFSIMAGIFAVGAIFGMVDQLLTGMDMAHQEIDPAHVNVILRNYIPQDLVEELKSIPGVEDIDPVNQITIRYRLNEGDDWELGTLVERPDYDSQTFDLVTLQEGEWPGDGQLGIERMSSQFYGIGIGDSVIIEKDGEPVSFEMNGLLRHPFVEPPSFGGQAHFFIDEEGLSEFGIPQGYFGQLLVRVEDYSEEKAQEIAGDIRSYLAEQGVGVVVNLYQDPDKHWGRMFVEGVTLVLQVMAIVSLFLSVVIVFNTMTALITQQTDQIGVIKAIGGGRFTIGSVYFAEVITFSLVALALAIPLSLAFAFFMSQNFLNLFNIDYESFQFSQRALVIQIMTGLFIPILAALIPVWNGIRVTVREAISSYGIGADFGRSFFDRIVEKFGALFLPTLYAASLGNVFRRKGRLILTLFVLVIAGVMFMVTMSLVSSIEFTLDNETARQKYDIRIGMFALFPSEQLFETIDGLDGINEAQVWVSRNTTILRDGERLQDSAGLGAQLIGIPAGEAMIEPLILKGRWLESGDQDAVVINQETAEKNQIEIGDEITLDLGDLGEVTWDVIGTYQNVYATGFDVEPIYAPLDSMQSLPGLADQANQLLVTADVNDLESEAQLLDEMVALFEEVGIPVDFYTTTARLEARDYADNQFNTVITMLINLSILVSAVGGIGLMGSLGIGVVERRREIGVMRAIGGGSRPIRRILLMEGFLQGFLSYFIAVPLAYLLAKPMANVLGQTMLGINLDYAFHIPSIGIWLALILVIAVSSSLLPSRAATRVSVRESLSYA